LRALRQHYTFPQFLSERRNLMPINRHLGVLNDTYGWKRGTRHKMWLWPLLRYSLPLCSLEGLMMKLWQGL
jgi:hypothetical protein